MGTRRQYFPAFFFLFIGFSLINNNLSANPTENERHLELARQLRSSDVGIAREARTKLENSEHLAPSVLREIGRAFSNGSTEAATLLKTIKSPYPELQIFVARGLSSGNRYVSDTATEILRSSVVRDPLVQREIALAFEQSSYNFVIHNAVGILTNLQSSDSEVQRTLVRTLSSKFGSISGSAASILKASPVNDPAILREIGTAFANGSFEAGEVLKSVKSTEPEVQRSVVHALKNDSSLIAKSASEILLSSQVTDPLTVRDIARTLRDGGTQAAPILKKLKPADPEAQLLLIQALKGDRRWIATAAQEILESLDNLNPRIIRSLGDEVIEGNEYATKVLDRLAKNTSFNPVNLIELWDRSPDSIRPRVAQALQESRPIENYVFSAIQQRPKLKEVYFEREMKRTISPDDLEAERYFTGLLSSQDPFARRLGKEKLKKATSLAPVTQRRLADLLRKGSLEAGKILQSHPPADEAAQILLAEAVSHPDTSIQTLALQLLKEIDPKSSFVHRQLALEFQKGSMKAGKLLQNLNPTDVAVKLKLLELKEAQNTEMRVLALNLLDGMRHRESINEEEERKKRLDVEEKRANLEAEQKALNDKSPAKVAEVDLTMDLPGTSNFDHTQLNLEPLSNGQRPIDLDLTTGPQTAQQAAETNSPVRCKGRGCLSRLQKNIHDKEATAMAGVGGRKSFAAVPGDNKDCGVNYRSIFNKSNYAKVWAAAAVGTGAWTFVNQSLKNQKIEEVENSYPPELREAFHSAVFDMGLGIEEAQSLMSEIKNGANAQERWNKIKYGYKIASDKAGMAFSSSNALEFSRRSLSEENPEEFVDRYAAAYVYSKDLFQDRKEREHQTELLAKGHHSTNGLQTLAKAYKRAGRFGMGTQRAREWARDFLEKPDGATQFEKFEVGMELQKKYYGSDGYSAKKWAEEQSGRPDFASFQERYNLAGDFAKKKLKLEGYSLRKWTDEKAERADLASYLSQYERAYDYSLLNLKQATFRSREFAESIGGSETFDETLKSHQKAFDDARAEGKSPYKAKEDADRVIAGE